MAFTRRLAALGAARSYARRNASQVHSAVDRVADAVRGRAPQQHRDKVDTAGNLLKKALTGTSDRGARAQGGRGRRSHR